MKNKYKDGIKLTILLSIGICGLIIAVIYGMDYENVGTELGLSQSYDWLSFLGNCIAGLVGAIVPISVMFYTLEAQKEKEEKEREILYTPILSFQFRCQQYSFLPEENKQLINGNFHDCINLVDKDEIEERDAAYFFSEMKIINVSKPAENVRIETFVDGKSRQEQHSSVYISIVEEPFYYYINVRQRDYNQRHDILVNIKYFSILGDEYRYSIKIIIDKTDMKVIDFGKREKI